jgi:hypothetical protein
LCLAQNDSQHGAAGEVIIDGSNVSRILDAKLELINRAKAAGSVCGFAWKFKHVCMRKDTLLAAVLDGTMTPSQMKFLVSANATNSR